MLDELSSSGLEDPLTCPGDLENRKKARFIQRKVETS